MLVRVSIAAAFLAFVGTALWAVLDAPGNTLSPWVLAAYAVVFTALATYRVDLEVRERQMLAAGPGDAVRPALLQGGALPVVEQLAAMALPLSLLLVLLYAPQEATMKQLQRIFYVHVASAWCAYLAFLVVFIGSVRYLWRRRPDDDRLALAAAEPGVLFTTLVLISGPIWAKPAWGIWWDWDARLTLTLILWLVYIGYLMLRAQVTDPDRARTLAAVVGVFGFIGVPINYMAIRWWEGQHPRPVIAGDEESGLDPLMARAFWFNVAVFSLILVAFLLRRQRLARAADAVACRDVEGG